MNSSRKYYRRPETSCLPIDFQYNSTSAFPSQPAFPMLSFESPRVNDQQYMNTWSTNIFDNPTSMTTTQSSTEWTSPAHMLGGFDDQASSDYYGYSTTSQSNGNNGSFQRIQTHSNVPRSAWLPSYDPRIAFDNSVLSENYEPSIYMIESNKTNSQNTSASGSDLSYDTRDSSREFARLSICHSPEVKEETPDSAVASCDKPSRLLVASTESSYESGNSSREMTAVDTEDPNAEEPYAKLIYRALMSAPNHAMVLQEIYQWFRENTSKGSSDSKGWMNSIRHNLSMNAAFKKMERKLSSEETKKSTEWVLDDFAIKDGVQSTTRYRKRTGTQKYTKSETPAPLRQISGRKGGICASKTNSSRQRIKDDRSDPRRPIQRLDTGVYPYRHPSRSRITREISPMTPCPESLPFTHPFFLPKAEQIEVPMEDVCGLEEIQGVYIDDGPLFSNGHESHLSAFHDPQQTCAAQRY